MRRRIMRAVGMGVMHDRVHVLADQFLGLPAQHAFGRRIDEGGLAVGVDAVDAFAGGAQDQLVLAFDVAEEALDPLPFLDAAADIEIGFAIDRAPPLQRRGRSAISSNCGAPSPTGRCRHIPRASSWPGGVARIQIRGSRIRPCAITAVGEHDQRRQLPGMQRRDPHAAQERRGHSRAGGRRRDWRRGCDPAPDRPPASARRLASKMRPKSADASVSARFSCTSNGHRSTRLSPSEWYRQLLPNFVNLRKFVNRSAPKLLAHFRMRQH